MSEFTAHSDKGTQATSGDTSGFIPEQNNRRSLEVILGLLPLVLGLQLMIWMVYLPAALRGYADFRNCYSTGLLLRTGRGHQIYNYDVQRTLQDNLISRTATGMPYVHPPYEALLFAPLSFLTYRGAFFFWLGVNLFCLLASYHILKKRLWQLHSAWAWLPVLFFIGFAPISGSLLQGQDSLITLFLLSAALAVLESGNDTLAGFLVGLASYKFQLVLPITCLFFFWRRWRFVAGTCISALFALIASAVVSGTTILFSYFGYVRETSVKFAVLMPSGRMPNLRGLVSLLHLPSAAGTALLLALSTAALILAGWGGRKASVGWQFAIAVSAAALVGYHVMMHDLSAMLIPMAMILDDDNMSEPWTVSLLWLSSALCFFGLGPFVALPLLALFLFQALKFPLLAGIRSQWQSGQTDGKLA